MKQQSILIKFKWFSGGNGDFAVQLSNKRLFYGRAFVEHVVEVSVNYFCFDILLSLCNFLIQFQFIFYQIFPGEDPSSNFTVMFDIFSSLLLITSNGYVFEQTLLAVCVVKYNHTLMLDWCSCHGNSMSIPHIIQSD